MIRRVQQCWVSVAAVGRLADAIVAHRQAIKLKPDYAEAFLALGQCPSGSKATLEEAMGAYRSAIAVKRD